jgi:hypothetical protein
MVSAKTFVLDLHKRSLRTKVLETSMTSNALGPCRHAPAPTGTLSKGVFLRRLHCVSLIGGCPVRRFLFYRSRKSLSSALNVAVAEIAVWRDRSGCMDC